MKLEDVICVWLDEAIPILEKLEFLKWPAERDISLPEALRATFFYAIKRAISLKEIGTNPRRKAVKFPSSVISRVQNAISHLNSRRISEELRPRNTVFLAMTIPQLAQQIPVARALEEMEKSYCFFFKSNKWTEEIDLNGLDVAYHSRSLQCELLSARLRARVLWLRIGREELLDIPQLSFEQNTIDLSSVVLETLSYSITSVFEAHVLAKYVVDHIRPRLIVVGNDLVPLGRVMTACAKRYGIRSVCLLSQAQDGPIDAYHPSDRFVVFGNYSKRVLSASGIDTKKIKTCGAPYLDALASEKPLPFLTRRFQDPESKKGFFIVAEFSSNWVVPLLAIAKESPRHFILILADDKSDMRHYQRLESKSPNLKICLRSDLSSGNYASCLKSADWILSSSFKTAIEAMGLGKNVIVLDFANEFDNPDFSRAEVVPVARNESSLTKILFADHSSELDPSSANLKRKFFDDYFYRRDGNSSQRIARVLVEECQK